MKRSVFIIEQSAALLQELTDVITLEPNFRVCGTLSGISLATYKQIQAIGPDVVLMDADLPGSGGIKLMRLLRAKMSETKLAAFSKEKGAETVAKIMKLGADGFILKNEEPEELINALKDILSGHIFVSDQIFCAGGNFPKNVSQRRGSTRKSSSTWRPKQFLLV